MQLLRIFVTESNNYAKNKFSGLIEPFCLTPGQEIKKKNLNLARLKGVIVLSNKYGCTPMTNYSTL